MKQVTVMMSKKVTTTARVPPPEIQHPYFQCRTSLAICRFGRLLFAHDALEGALVFHFGVCGGGEALGAGFFTHEISDQLLARDPIGFLTDQGARLLALDPEEDATRW